MMDKKGSYFMPASSLVVHVLDILQCIDIRFNEQYFNIKQQLHESFNNMYIHNKPNHLLSIENNQSKDEDNNNNNNNNSSIDDSDMNTIIGNTVSNIVDNILKIHNNEENSKNSTTITTTTTTTDTTTNSSSNNNSTELIIDINVIPTGNVQESSTVSNLNIQNYDLLHRISPTLSLQRSLSNNSTSDIYYHRTSPKPHRSVKQVSGVERFRSNSSTEYNNSIYTNKNIHMNDNNNNSITKQTEKYMNHNNSYTYSSSCNKQSKLAKISHIDKDNLNNIIANIRNENIKKKIISTNISNTLYNTPLLAMSNNNR
jgi:hypothetical protein